MNLRLIQYIKQTQHASWGAVCELIQIFLFRSKNNFRRIFQVCSNALFDNSFWMSWQVDVLKKVGVERTLLNTFNAGKNEVSWSHPTRRLNNENPSGKSCERQLTQRKTKGTVVRQHQGVVKTQPFTVNQIGRAEGFVASSLETR